MNHPVSAVIQTDESESDFFSDGHHVVGIGFTMVLLHGLLKHQVDKYICIRTSNTLPRKSGEDPRRPNEGGDTNNTEERLVN